MNDSKLLKLGIVGFGFVGKATDYGFDKDVKKFIVDPSWTPILINFLLLIH